MDLRDPAPGAPWTPDQFWVCARCGRHFWSTYPSQAKPAVAKPAEGTILTLMRELTDEARGLRRKKLSLEQCLDALVTRGEEALERTREQNPLLAEAGVVDAGAAGLLVCLRAIARMVAGAPALVEAPVLRLVASPPER